MLIKETGLVVHTAVGFFFCRYTIPVHFPKLVLLRARGAPGAERPGKAQGLLAASCSSDFQHPKTLPLRQPASITADDMASVF